MDEMQKESQTPEPSAEETPRYQPRPRWQIWTARMGLVLFIIVLILYYLQLLRGGM